LSHNKSAKWIFDLRQRYRPGRGVYGGAILIAYDLDDTAIDNIKTRDHIDFENPDFTGEGKHPTKIIVKNNELGAYGLGTIRQGITNHHANARYATKREVASALNLNVREVSDAYKPATGWPR